VGRDPSRHQGSSELQGSALSCCRVCRAPTREDGGQLRFQLIRLRRTQRLPRTTPLRAINNLDKRQCSLSTLVFPRMTSANGEPSTFPVSLTRSEPPPVTVPRGGSRGTLRRGCTSRASSRSSSPEHRELRCRCARSTQTSDHTMARSRSAVSCTFTSDATGPAAERRGGRDEFVNRTADWPARPQVRSPREALAYLPRTLARWAPTADRPVDHCGKDRCRRVAADAGEGQRAG
jgi:hypothetical protein